MEHHPSAWLLEPEKLAESFADEGTATWIFFDAQAMEATILTG